METLEGLSTGAALRINVDSEHRESDPLRLVNLESLVGKPGNVKVTLEWGGIRSRGARAHRGPKSGIQEHEIRVAEFRAFHSRLTNFSCSQVSPRLDKDLS